MTPSQDIRMMAETIIRTHDGRSYFNFGEASRIIGCGVNTVARLFHENGITVKKVGPSKRVSAYEIAEVMRIGHVAAIDS